MGLLDTEIPKSQTYSHIQYAYKEKAMHLLHRIMPKLSNVKEIILDSGEVIKPKMQILHSNHQIFRSGERLKYNNDDAVFFQSIINAELDCSLIILNNLDICVKGINYIAFSHLKNLYPTTVACFHDEMHNLPGTFKNKKETELNRNFRLRNITTDASAESLLNNKILIGIKEADAKKVLHDFLVVYQSVEGNIDMKFYTAIDHILKQIFTQRLEITFTSIKTLIINIGNTLHERIN